MREYQAVAFRKKKKKKRASRDQIPRRSKPWTGGGALINLELVQRSFCFFSSSGCLISTTLRLYTVQSYQDKWTPTRSAEAFVLNMHWRTRAAWQLYWMQCAPTPSPATLTPVRKQSCFTICTAVAWVAASLSAAIAAVWWNTVPPRFNFRSLKWNNVLRSVSSLAKGWMSEAVKGWRVHTTPSPSSCVMNTSCDSFSSPHACVSAHCQTGLVQQGGASLVARSVKQLLHHKFTFSCIF